MNDRIYRLLKLAEDSVQGIPIQLRLQQVTLDKDQWYTVSWRSRYPNSPQTNRRFYWLESGCWTLPLKTALRLMEKANGPQYDLFDARYDDPFRRFDGGAARFIVSFQVKTASQRTRYLEEITCSDETMWGREPFFVIGIEPSDTWRKIMLVNTGHTVVTFRSCTVYNTGHIRNMGRVGDWKLDNTMMDCPPQMMREFLHWLKRN
jgi:hypothetical protein